MDAVLVRATKSVVLVKSLDARDRFPFKVRRRVDDKLLDQFDSKLDALEAWQRWYGQKWARDDAWDTLIMDTLDPTWRRRYPEATNAT